MPSPSQTQVVDEIWDDQRIRNFLNLQPFDQLSADFYVLLRAYQGMRSPDFKRFISFFTEAGRNVHARDEKGRTILDIISKHRQSEEFVKILESTAKEPIQHT